MGDAGSSYGMLDAFWQRAETETRVLTHPTPINWRSSNVHVFKLAAPSAFLTTNAIL